jgi:hypothetical protein
MSSLPREISDKDILKGKLYYVALPFTAGRPLSFVEEVEGQEGFFKVITKDDGLEGQIDPNTGKKKAAEHKVVTGIKMRPCVVIQPNEYNQNERYPFVIVLPVETMKKSHKSKGIYKRMIKTNDLPMLYYLGGDNYITINDPYKVYKNVLFGIDVKLNYSVTDIDIEEIMKRFAQCFEIKKIKECDECEKNCDKCEYKLAVNK